MLNRYHKPNKEPSSRVLNKLLEEAAAAPSSALSGTETARDVKGSEEGRGLNLKEEEGEEGRDQDRRVKETALEVTVSLLGLEEKRMGSKRGVCFEKVVRGLRRGKEGEG